MLDPHWKGICQRRQKDPCLYGDQYEAMQLQDEGHTDGASDSYHL